MISCSILPSRTIGVLEMADDVNIILEVGVWLVSLVELIVRPGSLQFPLVHIDSIRLVEKRRPKRHSRRSRSNPSLLCSDSRAG